MNNAVKLSVIGFFISLAILVVALMLIPLFINPNSYKPEISAFIKNKTGKDVVIEGDITLSLLPHINANTGKITVGGKPDAQDNALVTVESTAIQLHALPLLSGKVEIHSIELNGLTLHVSKDKKGRGNWDESTVSLPNLPPIEPENQISKDNAKQIMQAMAGMAIGAITVKKGRVIWENHQNGDSLDISNIDYSSDKVVVGEPFAVNMKANISGKPWSFPGSIKMVSGLLLNEALDNIKLGDTHLEWSGKSVTSQQPLTAAVNFKTADINLTQQTLTSSGVALQSGDINLLADINGEHLLTKPAFNGQIKVSPFNPRFAMKQWEIAHPNTADEKVLSNFMLASTFRLTPESANFTNLEATLDDSHAQGSFNINSFNPPVAAFDLAVDHLDLDRYLPPHENTGIASPGFALAAKAVGLSLDWLKQLEANGMLKVGSLKVNRMTLQDTLLTFGAKNAAIKIGQSAQQFYNGVYASDISWVIGETSQVSLRENMTIIQLDTLLQDVVGKAKMGGLLTSSTNIKGSGNTTKALLASLSGTVSFFLKDGFFQGFNLEKMLEQAKNTVINGKPLETDDASDSTAFNAIKGTIAIDREQLHNTDLVMDAAKFFSKGEGRAALDSGQLEYKVTTKLVKAPASANSPALLHSTPIVVHVGGTFSKPSFTLDVGALLTDENKDRVKSIIDHNKDKINKLLNKLDKKTGSDVKDLLKKIF